MMTFVVFKLENWADTVLGLIFRPLGMKRFHKEVAVIYPLSGIVESSPLPFMFFLLADEQGIWVRCGLPRFG